MRKPAGFAPRGSVRRARGAGREPNRAPAPDGGKGPRVGLTLPPPLRLGFPADCWVPVPETQPRLGRAVLLDTASAVAVSRQALPVARLVRPLPIPAAPQRIPSRRPSVQPLPIPPEPQQASNARSRRPRLARRKQIRVMRRQRTAPVFRRLSGSARLQLASPLLRLSQVQV
jgi:hypothetical protein